MLVPDNGDIRRVAVRCANCETIVPARVKPDGAVDPIGRGMVCDCDEPDVQIIENDDPADNS